MPQMSKPIILAKENSVFNHFLAEIRDRKFQQDRMKFRRNLERVGEILAYEMSKKFKYDKVDVRTPLGTAETSLFKAQPVIATILRAGLPMHQGILNYFDHADNAFVSAYRKSKKNDELEIIVEYMKSPSLKGRTLVISDPMLATGRSMISSIQALLDNGKPAELHIVCLLASQEGLEYVQSHLPMKAKIWCGDVDPELNSKSYIIPGLGDAGDLAFGGD